MAEEIKKEEKKCDCGKLTGTIFKVILGLAFLTLGLCAVVVWFHDLAIVFKGCIGLFAILAGVITLAIAKE